MQTDQDLVFICSGKNRKYFLTRFLLLTIPVNRFRRKGDQLSKIYFLFGKL